MGLNTILRKIPEGGHYPSRENQSKQKNVTVDVRIYKERGNADSLDMKHSGTFTGMTDKGQGTSAKGYYWWNITDGFEDDVEITAEEYNSSDPTHYVDGGKYFKKISYFNSLDGVVFLFIIAKGLFVTLAASPCLKATENGVAITNLVKAKEWLFITRCMSLKNRAVIRAIIYKCLPQFVIGPYSTQFMTLHWRGIITLTHKFCNASTSVFKFVFARLLRIRKRLSDSILFSMVRKLAMTFAMQWV